jgi:methionyl-tRNA synthetase
MSKSKLTGIAPSQVVDHFGVDAFRYYFLRAIQFGQDGSFSWEDMAARYTAELANGLGNLGSRATAMVEKYFAGSLPAPGPYGSADDALAEALTASVTAAQAAYSRLDFMAGIGAVRAFIDAVNLYVTEQQPWALAKEEGDAPARERLATVLYVTCESLRAIAVLHSPVMPRAMGKLWESIGAAQGLGPIEDQRISDVARWGQLPPGLRVTKGAALFPRLPEEVPASA